MANAPPTVIHLVDSQGRLSWPYVFATLRTFNPDTFAQTYSEQYKVAYPIKLFVRGENTAFSGSFQATFTSLV